MAEIEEEFRPYDLVLDRALVEQIETFLSDNQPHTTVEIIKELIKEKNIKPKERKRILDLTTHKFDFIVLDGWLNRTAKKANFMRNTEGDIIAKPEPEVQNQSLNALLADDSIDESVRAVLCFAIENPTFRMEELGKRSEYFKAKGKAAFREFRTRQANRVFDTIEELLTDSEIVAHWVKEGNTKGKEYSLVFDHEVSVEPEVPAERQPSEPKVVVLPLRINIPTRTAETAETAQLRRAAQFTLQLVRGAHTFVQERGNGEGRIKRSSLRAEIALGLGVDKDIAETLLQQLVEKRYLFSAGTERGHGIVSISPVVKPPKKEVAEADRKAKEFDPRGAFDDEELHISEKLIRHLVEEITHANKGETIAALHRMIGGDVPIDRFRKIVRKLEGRRYIQIDNSANYGRARKGALVKLRSQDFKNRWKGSKEGLLNRLREPMPVRQEQ